MRLNNSLSCLTPGLLTEFLQEREEGWIVYVSGVVEEMSYKLAPSVFLSYPGPWVVSLYNPDLT